MSYQIHLEKPSFSLPEKLQRDFSLLWSYPILFFILSFSRPLIFKDLFCIPQVRYSAHLGLSFTCPRNGFWFSEFRVFMGPVLASDSRPRDPWVSVLWSLVIGHKQCCGTPDPKTAMKDRGEKNLLSNLFFWSYKFHKIELFYFEMLKKKICANF
jgi:hypothetical protein